MIRPKLFTTVVAVVTVVLLGACGGSAGGGVGKARDLGPVRWRWRPPPGASVGMPAADGDGVVATYSHTFVVALKGNGNQLWRVRRLGVREGTPLLTPDLVVVPADDGLVAFERGTGRIRWDARLGHSAAERPDPDDAASTPVLAGSTVVTCLSGGVLIGVEASAGTVSWRAPLDGRCDGSPATDGRTVVATWDPELGDQAGIGAFDPSTGARRWTALLRAGAVSGPALVHTDDGHTLAVTVDHDLAAKAFSVGDGRPEWTTPVGGAGSPEAPPLALPGGRVLVADRVGGLTLLDARGRRQWSTRVDAAVVRGGPVGPAPGGVYVLPLYNGRVLLAGPQRASSIVDAPGGLANGVALAPDGSLFLSSAQGEDDQLVAYRP